MEEYQLVKSLKNGSHTAFTCLYNRYAKQVFNFSKLYVSVEVSEEIVQDVFIKLWFNRSQISIDKNFEGYLFIITRNHIFDQCRKNKNSNYFMLSLLSAFEYQSDDDLEGELCSAELKEIIEGLIENLPPRCKEVFYLSRYEQLTNAEIANKLGISKKTVEAAITRALKYLKEHLLLIIFLSLSINN